MKLISMSDRTFMSANKAKRQSSGLHPSPILPVMIPEISEVKAFANHLHAVGRHWHGEIFGWSAEYTPESRKKPSGSKMPFTPTDFWIGESGIWFYSLMWEHGKNEEPVEFLDDRGVIKQKKRRPQTLRPADVHTAPPRARG